MLSGEIRKLNGPILKTNLFLLLNAKQAKNNFLYSIFQVFRNNFRLETVNLGYLILLIPAFLSPTPVLSNPSQEGATSSQQSVRVNLCEQNPPMVEIRNKIQKCKMAVDGLSFFFLIPVQDTLDRLMRLQEASLKFYYTTGFNKFNQKVIDAKLRMAREAYSKYDLRRLEKEIEKIQNSRVPSREELIRKIQSRVQKKLLNKVRIDNILASNHVYADEYLDLIKTKIQKTTLNAGVKFALVSGRNQEDQDPYLAQYAAELRQEIIRQNLKLADDLNQKLQKYPLDAALKEVFEQRVIKNKKITQEVDSIVKTQSPSVAVDLLTQIFDGESHTSRWKHTKVTAQERSEKLTLDQLIRNIMDQWIEDQDFKTYRDLELDLKDWEEEEAQNSSHSTYPKPVTTKLKDLKMK